MEDNPTIYLSIDKSDFSEKIYSQLNIEAQLSKVNDGIVPKENMYHFGKLNEYYINYYKLKKDKNKSFIFIEISFNSDYLDFSINNGIVKVNRTNLIVNSEKSRGKTLIIIDTRKENSDFIFLNIFKKGNEINNAKLYNYVFRYVKLGKVEEIVNYKILYDNNLLIINEKIDEIDDENITYIECSFYKIDIEKDKANITYYLKIIDGKTYNNGESYEAIAIMESPYYTIYEKNPPDNNGKITLKVKDNF